MPIEGRPAEQGASAFIRRPLDGMDRGSKITQYAKVLIATCES